MFDRAADRDARDRMAAQLKQARRQQAYSASDPEAHLRGIKAEGDELLMRQWLLMEHRQRTQGSVLARLDIYETVMECRRVAR